MGSRKTGQDTPAGNTLKALRQRAGTENRLQGEPLTEPLLLDEARQLLQELRVQQIELEIQNEELRRTHQQLEKSKARYFELYDLAPLGYLTIDGQGLILEANLAAVTLLGMPRTTLLNQPLTRFIPPEDQDLYYLQRKQLLAKVTPLTWDMRVLSSAGSSTWTHLQAIPGQDGEVRIMLEDITRHKAAEDILAANLRLSEYAVTHSMDELLTRIVDEAEALTGSSIGFFHFLEQDQVTLSLQAWSSNTLRTMCTAEGKGQHYSVDKAGVWVDCIHTGKAVIHNDYAALRNRKGLPQGHAPIVRELVVPVFRDERIVGIVGVGNKPGDYLEQDIEAVSRLINFTWDIVMGKQSEEELKKNENQYRTTLHTLLDGFWVVDMRGRFIDVNEAYCNIIGYTRNELLGMSIQDVEALENSAEIEQRRQMILTGGSQHFESKHRCKNGQIVDLDICVSHLREHNRLCASLRDITAFNQATESLRTASIYTRSLIEASLDPLVTIRADGTITDVNEASVRVTGVPREQLIGTDFCNYFTEPEKAREGYHAVFSAGEVHDYPLAIRHVSGTVTDVLYNASIYRDEQGEVQGVFAAARDVTGLRKALKLLQKANDELETRVAERTSELAQAHEEMKKVSFELIWAEEKERERIAGELHDRVGQSLLLAKMKLDALGEKLPDESTRSWAVDAASLVQMSIHDIRSLTFRMRPPLLETAEIDTVLKWLCTSISNDYNLLAEFTGNGQPASLNVETRYSLYQAVRELLINVAKHARTHRAQVSLTTIKGILAVSVADEGAGFTPKDGILKHANNGGFGLYNVRQRIEYLGGSCCIESAPGTGTQVTLTLPLAEN
jgi:PAS domain S-box-containing protein